jgi:hypothetical protein
MQTMGPMMSNMTQGSGGLGASGLGGLDGFGGNTPATGLDASVSPAGGFAGGGDLMGMLGGSGMTTMIPQLVGLAGSGNSHHRRRRHH